MHSYEDVQQKKIDYQIQTEMREKRIFQLTIFRWNVA